MARPKKKNADYFPHDSDMRNDPKVKALRRKFGFIGYSVWSMLLEVLTDSDYFEYKWNDLNIELLAGDFDLEPEVLKEIVDYCITIKLLSIESDILYTEKLKERFDTLLSRRSVDRKRKDEEFSTRKTPNKEVFHSENPQSKVKESKVKESKVNIIDNNSFSDNAKKQSQWLETISMQQKVSPDAVRVFIDSFRDHLVIMEEQKPNEKEFKKHFSNWINKQDLSNLRTKPAGRSNQLSYAD